MFTGIFRFANTSHKHCNIYYAIYYIALASYSAFLLLNSITGPKVLFWASKEFTVPKRGKILGGVRGRPPQKLFFSYMCRFNFMHSSDIWEGNFFLFLTDLLTCSIFFLLSFCYFSGCASNTVFDEIHKYTKLHVYP